MDRLQDDFVVGEEAGRSPLGVVGHKWTTFRPPLEGCQGPAFDGKFDSGDEVRLVGDQVRGGCGVVFRFPHSATENRVYIPAGAVFIAVAVMETTDGYELDADATAELQEN